MGQLVGRCVALFPNELAEFLKTFPKKLPLGTVQLMSNDIFDVLDKVRQLPSLRLSMLVWPDGLENDNPIFMVYAYLCQSRNRYFAVHGFFELNDEWYRIKTSIAPDGNPLDCYMYHIE